MTTTTTLTKWRGPNPELTKQWDPAPEKPTSTIGLLHFALAGGDSARELSRRLEMNANGLNVAQHRQRLSPTAAGKLAKYVGLAPELWIALAALEAEPISNSRDSLMADIKRRIAVLKS